MFVWIRDGIGEEGHRVILLIFIHEVSSGGGISGKSILSGTHTHTHTHIYIYIYII